MGAIMRKTQRIEIEVSFCGHQKTKHIDKLLSRTQTHRVFPIIAPQLNDQITYSPNHGNYTIMERGL